MPMFCPYICGVAIAVYTPVSWSLYPPSRENCLFSLICDFGSTSSQSLQAVSAMTAVRIQASERICFVFMFISDE